MKVLAELLKGVESETPYGGRAVSWEPRGSAWLKLGARRRREKNEPGGARAVETATARILPGCAATSFLSAAMLRAKATTLAPSATKCSTIERPIPLLAPVTTAILPSNFFCISCPHMAGPGELHGWQLSD